MRNLFNMDNPLFRTLSRLADLMILNIVFLICCIPIFTIGASLTGMYYVALKMSDNDEGYIARGFWKSFRLNFKQATGIWLIMLAVGCLLGADMYILNNLAEMSATFLTVLKVLIMVTIVLYTVEFLYIFPTLAKFDNTVKNTFKNAFIMALADFPRTLLMLLIVIASVVVTFFNSYTLWYGILIWILCGFSLIAFANSFFFKKIFARYIPEETEADDSQWSIDENTEENTDENIDEKTDEGIDEADES